MNVTTVRLIEKIWHVAVAMVIMTSPAVVQAQASPAESLTDTLPSMPKVGLVLSGGGAKGIAHVGVIQALEENDIPIDYVTGTSMGAIVGSLYSCGWSPDRMMHFFTQPDFTYWSTGVINPRDIYYFSKPEKTPEWVSVNLNFNDTTSAVTQILPSSLINPLPMNIEFLKLFSPYSLQCEENFDNLMVPFRCVCSDVYHKHKIVLGNGSLGDAVRASMSFPLVFRPITIDGVLVYDGGIYDNFPVNVMEDVFNPDFIIGVSVSGADKKPVQGDIYSQLEDMIIQNNDYSVPSGKGVKIQVPVLNFGVLDFPQAKTIYKIGYETGLAMVDSIKERISSRVPLSVVTRRREGFASRTPAVMFDSVAVTGVKRSQADYLRFLFQGKGRQPFDMNHTVDAYYRAVTDGTLTNLVPQAEFGRNGNNTLLLEATPKRPWSIGIGGWVSSSVNSMLYVDLGYHSLSYNSLGVSLSGWVGQSYYAGMLSGRFTLRNRVPSFLQIDAVVSNQKYYDTELLFYQTGSPSFISELETFARFHYVRAFGKRAEGFVSLAGGNIRDSYFPDNHMDYADEKKDRTQYKVGVLRAGIRSGTLNDDMYPNKGYSFLARLQGSYEQSLFKAGNNIGSSDKYKGNFRGSLQIDWKHYFEAGKRMSVGVAASALGTLQNLNQNYTATLVHAPSFAPTPSTRNYYNEGFRSDNYRAAGVMPVWSPIDRLQLRGDFYVYSPIRNLVRAENDRARYSGWFRKAEFLGEVAVVYNFPFASLSVYGNYLSYPAHNWNFGINLGLLFQAPKLLH